MKTEKWHWVILLLMSTTSWAQTAKDYQAAGEKKYARQDYLGAIRDFSQAIVLDVSYAYAYINRGVCLYKLGRQEEAILDYSKVIALEPSNSYAYNDRGASLSELGRYEEAIQDYSRAIAFKPDNGSAYNNRGITLHSLGRYEEAVLDQIKAIALEPDEGFIYYNRGRSLYSLGRYKEAIQDYSKAIALKPNFAPNYVNRGVCLSNSGRYEEAVQDYSKAITLEPNSTLARDNLQRAQAKLNKRRVPKIWIVAAGIDTYDSPQLSALRSSVANAYRFKDLFKSANLIEEEQLAVLSNENADRDDLLSAIKHTLCDTLKVYPEDMVIFYFVGHGIAYENKYGICPHDYRGLDKLISEQELLEVLNTSPARHKLCLLEACKSKNLPMGSTVSQRTLDQYNNLRQQYATSTVVLSSTKVGQPSIEMDRSGGVFSRYLLLGLSGKADGYGSGKKDKVIHTKELFEYVRDNVARTTGNDQIPQINEMSLTANVPIIPVIDDK